MASTLNAGGKSAWVRRFHGRPTLFVDEQPMTPAIYALTHNHGVNRSWYERPARTLRAFAAAGIRLFQVDMYFEDIWHKDERRLDIGLLRRQVGGVLEACPDACVVIRVHVNAPFWWNDDHPDELTVYCTGPNDKLRDGTEWSHEQGDLDRTKRASLSSGVWRAEAGERLAELCRDFAVTPEGASVIGIHVACGVYGEWHYWGFLEHEPDIGPAMTAWFRAWLRKRYGSDAALRAAWKSDRWTLETATAPGLDERAGMTAGIFRDPSREQRVIDYYRCQHDVVADDIEYFCRLVKQHWPRPVITGVFYGYFHMMFCRQASGGHLEIERILNSPWVDYLSAPQSYWDETRRLGGSGDSRGIVESALIHGKLWLDEMDNGGQRTDADDPAYVPVARRSALLPLMRGGGLWYYDFGFDRQTGWWESPALLADVRAIKELFDRRMGVPYVSAADALVVWDDESFYYMKNGWTPVSYLQLDEANEDIWRSGVVADHVYLFDLDNIDLSRYRAIVFTNTYCMDAERRAFIRRHVAANGRWLVWNYLPGYTDGTRLDLAFVEELTGIRITAASFGENLGVVYAWDPALVNRSLRGILAPAAVIDDSEAEPLGRLADDGRVVAARKRLPTHTSIHAIAPLCGPALFRTLLREAGCHVYCDSNEPLYVSSGLLMLHTGSGGRRTIRLKNNRTIALELRGPSTIVFDAESGEVVLGEDG